jgi:hypothetical protein
MCLKKGAEMKIRILSWVMISMMFAVVTGVCRADDDARLIGKMGENSPTDSLRKASLYLVFNDNKAEGLPALPSGAETRFYSKVWEGLYLQVTTESGNRGTVGYKFYFSKDEAGEDSLDTKESKDGPSLREITASDFRSDDNFSVRPLKAGPGTPTDRGAFRVIDYEGFDATIRVLEFTIGDVDPQKKPYFKTISCLVTVCEKAPTK